MPFADTEAMQAHLAEISLTVDPGAHAVLMLDQAGWHMSGRLVVPDNITVVPLPPRSPELNPVENVWQFMRDNWLSNRVFSSYDDIVGHCCEAWNKLADQPWRIMTTGRRAWAHGSWSMGFGIRWARGPRRMLSCALISPPPIIALMALAAIMPKPATLPY